MLAFLAFLAFVDCMRCHFVDDPVSISRGQAAAAAQLLAGLALGHSFML